MWRRIYLEKSPTLISFYDNYDLEKKDLMLDNLKRFLELVLKTALKDILIMR